MEVGLRQHKNSPSDDRRYFSQLLARDAESQTKSPEETEARRLSIVERINESAFGLAEYVDVDHAAVAYEQCTRPRIVWSLNRILNMHFEHIPFVAQIGLSEYLAAAGPDEWHGLQQATRLLPEPATATRLMSIFAAAAIEPQSAPENIRRILNHLNDTSVETRVQPRIVRLASELYTDVVQRLESNHFEEFQQCFPGRTVDPHTFALANRRALQHATRQFEQCLQHQNERLLTTMLDSEQLLLHATVRAVSEHPELSIQDVEGIAVTSRRELNTHDADDWKLLQQMNFIVERNYPDPAHPARKKYAHAVEGFSEHTPASQRVLYSVQYEGRVQSFVVVTEEEPGVVHIGSMNTDSTMQGAHLKDVLDTVIQTQYGACTQRIEARVGRNQQLYEAMGYVVTGRLPNDGYGEMVTMERAPQNSNYNGVGSESQSA